VHGWLGAGANLGCDGLKLLQADLASSRSVEQEESLLHLFYWILPAHLPVHHVNKLPVLDCGVSICVDVLHHLVHLLDGWRKSERLDGDEQLLLVNVAATITIEEVERLLHLSHFLL